MEKIIFSPFKLSTIFSHKDFVPDSLKSRVVYQFTCASCGVRYIGENNRHFNTRVNEYLFLKVVGISVILLVLIFSIMPALTLNLK